MGAVLDLSDVTRGNPRATRAKPDPVDRRWLSERDRRILARAEEKLQGSAFHFDDALRALMDAVQELIPAGRCYFLGTRERRPVFGSVVSGVGITEGDHSVRLVLLDRGGGSTLLGRFGP